ncbi:MAG: hypothetical protein K8R68_06555 [Bacteroidales bacterium]|nr:hypothetical protein [Bacteroidales bacterium]
MKLFQFIIILFLLVSFFSCNNSEKKTENNSTPKQQIVAPVKTEREKPVLTYDDRGNIIKRHSKSYTKDNSIRSADDYFYKFDENNNRIEEIKESYNSSGELQYTTKNYFKYNQNNKLIEQNLNNFDANSNLLNTALNKFQYDNAGRKIKDTGYYPGGELKSIIVLSYGESGFLEWEEYIDYDENGKKTNHKKYLYTNNTLQKTIDLMK